jgi:hypothetical protein
MRGDFSAWNKDRTQNFRGTLHQQGRVSLDRDWNAQTEIVNEWQETAGRDAFGAGVAAVPAEVPLSFKVTGAKIEGGVVKISAAKGRVWADGLLVESTLDITQRVATYLNPPQIAVPNPANPPRDVVILETWNEELSAFQAPALLIEPALGGVDTTERVQTAYRFRLHRSDVGDTCDSIIPKLKDDFSIKGKLTVTLNPALATSGDCPVVESGGYTGFEHRLYRIEIAETKKTGAWFKWSQFNGGLVGTGDFDAVGRTVAIHGNINAIIHSGISQFYLEALDLDDTVGHWRVIYAAKATLGPDFMLLLPPSGDPNEFLGTLPPAPAKGKRFFRLWNGIEPVADYVAASKELPDLVGIKLKFDTGVAAKFTPADFWTFEVRSGGFGNPAVLVGDPVTFAGFPPQGIFYHRVPLGVVLWRNAVADDNDIGDCRHVFQPLTKLKTCCTYRVGDGIHSHGDFTKIQDAIDALPKVAGGEVCILPGLYEENIVLKAPHNQNIILSGCGRRTVIRFATHDPVIHVHYGQNIHIESLAVEAAGDGIGIFLEGEEKTAGDKNQEKYLRNISLSELFISAAKDCAIKAHMAQFLTLSNSVIYIRDSGTGNVAVYLAGDDMLVERSEIRVIPEKLAQSGDELSNDPDLFVPAEGAPGGLQIGGGSDRVRIIDNLIVGGTRNGITLGSMDLIHDNEVITNHFPFYPKAPGRNYCEPEKEFIDVKDETDDQSTPIAGPPLRDILIKNNRIFNMGHNGIGVATFFSLGDKEDPLDMVAIDRVSAKGMISVLGLLIVENRIERCMNSKPQEIPEKLILNMGYGGISLADTEELVIRDNFIVNNGPNVLEPICGIFVLMGQGIEISRNHVLNNGIRTTQEITQKSVKNGPRGGIFIAQARTPDIDAVLGSDKKATFSSGFPAATIHENIITVPLGRCLTVLAEGAVSVTGNQFTSFGIPPIDFETLLKSIVASGKLTAGDLLQILSLIAGNVLILNQGRAAFLSSAAGSFKNIKTGVAAKVDLKGAASSAASGERYFANGTVLFTNNQCHQNLFTPETGFALSSVFIVSLDDVGVHNNQCDCDIDDDMLLVNALVFGITARVSDNHFSETLMKVLFSAVTFGLHNITTDNESVHCLLVEGVTFLSRHNLVLFEIFGGVHGDIAKYTGTHPCDKYKGKFGSFGKIISKK